MSERTSGEDIFTLRMLVIMMSSLSQKVSAGEEFDVFEVTYKKSDAYPERRHVLPACQTYLPPGVDVPWYH